MNSVCHTHCTLDTIIKDVHTHPQAFVLRYLYPYLCEDLHWQWCIHKLSWPVRKVHAVVLILLHVQEHTHSPLWCTWKGRDQVPKKRHDGKWYKILTSFKLDKNCFHIAHVRQAGSLPNSTASSCLQFGGPAMDALRTPVRIFWGKKKEKENPSIYSLIPFSAFSDTRVKMHLGFFYFLPPEMQVSCHIPP